MKTKIRLNFIGLILCILTLILFIGCQVKRSNDDSSQILHSIKKLKNWQRPIYSLIIEEAYQSYKIWDFKKVLQILENYQIKFDNKETALYYFLFSKSLGYTGKYKEAYELLNNALIKYSAEPLIWNALLDINIALDANADTFNAFENGVEKFLPESAEKDIIKGKCKYFKAFNMKTHQLLDITSLNNGYKLLLKGLVEAPQGFGILFNEFDFLASSLYYLDRKKELNLIGNVLLIEDTDIINKFNIELSMCYFEKLTDEFKNKLNDHPYLILREFELINLKKTVNDSSIIFSNDIIEKIKKAIIDPRISNFLKYRLSLMYKLGYIYLIQERLNEAEKIYFEIKKYNPNYSQINKNLAFIYEKKGEWNKAADYLLVELSANWRGKAKTIDTYRKLLLFLSKARRYNDIIEKESEIKDFMKLNNIDDTDIIKYFKRTNSAW